MLRCVPGQEKAGKQKPIHGKLHAGTPSRFNQASDFREKAPEAAISHREPMNSR